MKEKLNPYSTMYSEEILTKCKNFFDEVGIILPKKNYVEDKVDVATVDWRKQFIIPAADTKAFYLKNDSVNEYLMEKIVELKEKLTSFQQGNLNQIMQAKIQNFLLNLTQAQRGVNFGLKKFKNSPAEYGDNYGEFIKKYFFEKIMTELYKELRENPADDACKFILRTMNTFLSDLGIYTPNGEEIVYFFNKGEVTDESLLGNRLWHFNQCGNPLE